MGFRLTQLTRYHGIRSKTEEVAILEIAPTIHETGEIATRRSLLQRILDGFPISPTEVRRCVEKLR